MADIRSQNLVASSLPEPGQRAVLEFFPDLHEHMVTCRDMDVQVFAELYPLLGAPAARKAICSQRLKSAHVDAVLASKDKRLSTINALLDLTTLTSDQLDVLASLKPPRDVAERVLANERASLSAKIVVAERVSPEMALSFYATIADDVHVKDKSILKAVDGLDPDTSTVAAAAVANLAFCRPSLVPALREKSAWCKVLAALPYDEETFQVLVASTDTGVWQRLLDNVTVPMAKRVQVLEAYKAYETTRRGVSVDKDLARTSVAPLSLQPDASDVPLAEITDPELLDELLWRPTSVFTVQRFLLYVSLAGNKHLSRAQAIRLLSLLGDYPRNESWFLWHKAVSAIFADHSNLEDVHYMCARKLKDGAPDPKAPYREKTARSNVKWSGYDQGDARVEDLSARSDYTRDAVAATIANLGADASVRAWRALLMLVDHMSVSAAVLVETAKAIAELDDSGFDVAINLASSDFVGTPAELVETAACMMVS